jgi:hypothetical protein
MSSGLLAALHARARAEGVSLNSFIVEVLASTVGNRPFGPGSSGDDLAHAGDTRAARSFAGAAPTAFDLMCVRGAYQNAHWGAVDAMELATVSDERVLEWDRAGRPRPTRPPDRDQEPAPGQAPGPDRARETPPPG